MGLFETIWIGHLSKSVIQIAIKKLGFMAVCIGQTLSHFPVRSLKEQSWMTNPDLLKSAHMKSSRYCHFAKHKIKKTTHVYYYYPSALAWSKDSLNSNSYYSDKLSLNMSCMLPPCHFLLYSSNTIVTLRKKLSVVT